MKSEELAMPSKAIAASENTRARFGLSPARGFRFSRGPRPAAPSPRAARPDRSVQATKARRAATGLGIRRA